MGVARFDLHEGGFYKHRQMVGMFLRADSIKGNRVTGSWYVQEQSGYRYLRPAVAYFDSSSIDWLPYKPRGEAKQ